MCCSRFTRLRTYRTSAHSARCVPILEGRQARIGGLADPFRGPVTDRGTYSVQILDDGKPVRGFALNVGGTRVTIEVL